MPPLSDAIARIALPPNPMPGEVPTLPVSGFGRTNNIYGDLFGGGFDMQPYGPSVTNPWVDILSGLMGGYRGDRTYG